MLPDLYDRLTRMVIDEDGDHSVGINHNRMLIEFYRRRENERGGNECKGFVTERDIDQIAERLEVTPEAEYERIMGRVRQELKKKRLRVGKRQKYSLKRWWDWDVRVAISARKDACRKHRTPVRARWPEQARSSQWEIYRNKKNVAASLIQEKLRNVDRGFLENLRRSGRDAPRNFWRHM
ncbi:hypothetical protein HPB47_017935 [Ixodes persulcatus]|uniref:Uncharacterized protein n=1 Tax=Ixodes persulcatus TaxID=34615 RepID=A0AC60QNZ5_IXOPE|nr:hypothetical protein HPB47_017935 [Ixodes persulcatus]